MNYPVYPALRIHLFGNHCCFSDELLSELKTNRLPLLKEGTIIPRTLLHEEPSADKIAGYVTNLKLTEILNGELLLIGDVHTADPLDLEEMRFKIQSKFTWYRSRSDGRRVITDLDYVFAARDGTIPAVVGAPCFTEDRFSKDHPPGFSRGESIPWTDRGYRGHNASPIDRGRLHSRINDRHGKHAVTSMDLSELIDSEETMQKTRAHIRSATSTHTKDARRYFIGEEKPLSIEDHRKDLTVTPIKDFGGDYDGLTWQCRARDNEEEFKNSFETPNTPKPLSKGVMVNKANRKKKNANAKASRKKNRK